LVTVTMTGAVINCFLVTAAPCSPLFRITLMACKYSVNHIFCKYSSLPLFCKYSSLRLYSVKFLHSCFLHPFLRNRLLGLSL
jgi:hypothetical protein